MKNNNFSLTFLLDQGPEEVFNAVKNVRGWWSETVTGNTEKAGDEFVYRHEPWHYSKQKLIEVIPNKKVVWLVTDGELSFTKDKGEWKDTKVIFEISKKGNKTELLFTHEGLTPTIECFEDCSKGWNHYVQGSLLQLITTGKGNPDKKQQKAKA